jgi:hypothetical protein
MSVDIRKQHRQAIAKADEELLAELGYKQEFRRAFKPIEVSYRPCFPIVAQPLSSLPRFSELRSASLASCLLSR